MTDKEKLRDLLDPPRCKNCIHLGVICDWEKDNQKACSHYMREKDDTWRDLFRSGKVKWKK